MAVPLGWDIQQVHNTTKSAFNTIRGGRAADGNASDFEPPQFRTASSKKQEPIIPDPTIFTTDQSSPKDDSLPILADCAIHLELLQCFNTMRHAVINSHRLDETWNIRPIPRIVWSGYRPNRERKRLRDTTFEDRRQAKWPIFVELAVERCLRWLEITNDTLDPCSEPPMKGMRLPPLDVLMVWHSLLLNPRYFARYCFENNLGRIREMEFPWAAIHQAIDNDIWSYHLDQQTETYLAGEGLDPNLLEYLISTSKQTIVSNIASSRWGEAALSSYAQIPPDAILKECLDRQEGLYATVKDIANAVHRQSSFVAKMDLYLWIRSPALRGTLERAIDRYGKFLKLIKLYPGTMLVPTLDIDLAWHTHQCSARKYEMYTMSYTGRFINHDDTVGTADLGTGLEKTQKLFQIRFCKEYLVCNCWDCEAINSELAKRDLGTLEDIELERVSKEIANSVAYFRAVELARRKRIALPAVLLDST